MKKVFLINGKWSKNFLRKLFDKKYCNYNNFFNDVLEDLFYVGLSVNLPDNYYPKLKCKVFSKWWFI